MKWLVFLLLLSSFAFAGCVEPFDGMIIENNVLFCSSTYDLPNGITVKGNDIVVDCGTAVLRGIVGSSEIGILLENVDNVTIINCNIVTFTQGIFLKNVTNSLIEDNAVLKNRIGIRLLDSFENVIRDNNDKSFQLAVSSVNSKYNIVMFGNKNVERDFCELNSCNTYRDMNPCEAGDFYCSRRCSYQTDSDCPSPEVIVVKEPVRSAEEIIAEAEEEVNVVVEPEKIIVVETRSVSLFAKFLIYFLLYFIAFIAVWVKKR